ncbi:hypothetical protein CROQUDRAFT_80137 [Cronartium quercuum f. sp. fusiforme G11]|uniref:Rho-GAP domain-containing protein n=1 Tax=Cronartium quercuum f. sp. fusiforme G11 TaxID=708437 RepID=A0A9P6NHF1_9BASI|nr:hypothetical protein CROQUDRAFT_80137 [Cronartium quercuum f. sp. fusiforme G11]
MSEPEPEPNPTEQKPAPANKPQPKIPPTFDRWFWTTDYRRGITILFDKLNAGVCESDELIAFIRKRASYERHYAHDLRSPIAENLDPKGFGFDDGASFLSAFHQLRSSQIELSETHAKLSLQLDRLVIAPFESWSLQHKSRLTSSFNQVETILGKWEKQAAEVAKLKSRYEQKLHEADDAEEDSRFSPAAFRRQSSNLNRQGEKESEDVDDDDDNWPLGISTGEGYAQIGKKVGEQAIGLGRAVSQRMRIGGGRVGFRAMSVESQSKSDSVGPPIIDADEEAADSPPDIKTLAQDQGERRADDNSLSSSPPAVDQHRSAPRGPMLIIAGVIKPPIEWSKLFEKARQTVYKQDVKIPLLGVYPNAHSGEDLVIFFKSNVPELGTTNRAVEFCRELSEELAVLRLIGEIGNKFMATHDAYYLWKPEAFTLHTISPDQEVENIITPLPERRHYRTGSTPSSTASSESGHVKRPSVTIGSPRSSITAPSLASLPATADTASKRASGGAGFAKILQTAVSQAAKGINDLGATVGVSAPPISVETAGETREERLRREAESAERTYMSMVNRLDQTRLVLEQTIAEHAAFLQRCELDRLRAAKAVIMGFNAALATLIPKMKTIAEASAVVHESFSPEADVAALVERYRTGPFRPTPVLFHSAKGQMSPNVNFGIDLGLWHVSQTDEQALVDVHPVLSRLLSTLEQKYPTIESHNERRKTWIYEVPLRAVHSLRSALNNPSKSSITEEQLSKLDAPLIAATIKLWLLELDPAPVHWSRYDDVRAVYPQGSEMPSVEARIEVLGSVLSRLPRPHLLVIDAVVSHLARLVKSTTTPDEKDEVYLTKLGLSVARGLLRPKVETAVTLSDRFQPIFLSDLVTHYDRILPVAIELRGKLVPAPQRKNTRPVDMRVKRSGLGIEGSVPDGQAQEILETHRRRISGSGMVFPPSPSPVASSSSSTGAETGVDHKHQAIPTTETVPVSTVEEVKTEGGELAQVGEDLDRPFVAPREAEGDQDQPFVPPQDVDEPFVPPQDADEPFVPPKDDFDAPFTPPVQVPSRPVDRDDIPLATKAHISRWGSGSTKPGSSPRSSLNRSRGMVSARGRVSSNSRPVSINTTTPVPAASGVHKKASPSFDSIRSQFEGKPTGSGRPVSKGKLDEVPDTE